MPSIQSLRTLVTLVFLSILFTFLFSKIWHRGKQIDTSERDKALVRKLARLQNCEQYSLRALKSGWFACTHCPKSLYYLRTNEIARYGMTCNRDSRYTDEQLLKFGVYYFVEFEGTMQEAVEVEAKKIFFYYRHPDNLARYENIRISLPPLNLRDD